MKIFGLTKYFIVINILTYQNSFDSSMVNTASKRIPKILSFANKNRYNIIIIIMRIFSLPLATNNTRYIRNVNLTVIKPHENSLYSNAYKLKRITSYDPT